MRDKTRNAWTHPQHRKVFVLGMTATFAWIHWFRVQGLVSLMRHVTVIVERSQWPSPHPPLGLLVAPEGARDRQRQRDKRQRARDRDRETESERQRARERERHTHTHTHTHTHSRLSQLKPFPVKPSQLKASRMAGRDKTMSAVPKVTVRGANTTYQVFPRLLFGIRDSGSMIRDPGFRIRYRGDTSAAAKVTVRGNQGNYQVVPQSLFGIRDSGSRIRD